MRVGLTISHQFVGALTDVKFRQSLKNASVQQSPWLTIVNVMTADEA
jgi:hypothetical protein